ncbi:hypothetical protein PP1_005445 [Pseudonocardia sp. P1]
MSDGELTAESLWIWCGVSAEDSPTGYAGVDESRYDEWRDWVGTVTDDELRDWVRRNSTASE